MNAWSGPGPMEFLMMMLLGGGFGGPSGIPPVQEDPLAAKVAPADCLFYAAWAETGTPSASSGNHTEEMLAEPEVQAFFDRTYKKITDAMKEADVPAPGLVGAASTKAIQLIRFLQTRPGAVFVSNLKISPGAPLEIEAGALMRVDDKATEVKELIEAFQNRPEFEVSSFDLENRSFYRVKFNDEAPIVEWGIAGKYVLMGLGQGSIESMMRRARGQAPAWLTEIQNKLPVARRCTVSYVNVSKGMSIAAEQSPEAARIMSALGVDKIRSITNVTGLDDTGFVSRALLAVDGNPGGLMSFIDMQPITSADLKSIPEGSPAAAGFQLDVAKLMDMWFDLVGQFDPNAAREMQQGLAGVEQQFGVKIREDIIGSLGDTWRIFAQPGPTGLQTGWTISIEVEDRDRLLRAHDHLLGIAKQITAQQGPRAPTIRTEVSGGISVHSLGFPPPIPVSPSWCVTNDALIIAVTKQSVDAVIAGQTGSSIADQPEMKPLFSGDSKTLAFAYADTRQVFQMMIPAMQMAIQLAAMQGQAPPGLTSDPSALPPIDVIARHLQPSIISVQRTSDGVELVSRQTFPGGNVGASAPVAVALLLPAVQASREAARRMQGSNNLKQLALSMHNYHDAYRSFPAGYSAGANGQALLSWRVHVLPFLGHQDLYSQFNLDEPWNSPQNKALIAKMPEIFKAPGSEAETGKTNYLGVGGTDGVFVQPKQGGLGTRFADIADGTSNTAMLVEAADEAAVIWTQPADFAPNPANPVMGLVGLRTGGFQMALADGSVHFIAETIDPGTLRALFTKRGGEAVTIP